MVVENIIGNLRDAYALVDPETILHCDELQWERLTDPSLELNCFCTADGCLYRMHEGKAQLALTRRNHNLVWRHIGDAFSQLLETGNYHPSLEESTASFNAGSTVCIDISQLGLREFNGEWGYLPISTRKYSTLSPEERKLAERVHGSGDTFAKIMASLAHAGIQETKLYVLNPSYVQEKTREAPIGRLCQLHDVINYSSNFDASDRSINSSVVLRGARLHSMASLHEPL